VCVCVVLYLILNVRVAAGFSKGLRNASMPLLGRTVQRSLAVLCVFMCVCACERECECVSLCLCLGFRFSFTCVCVCVCVCVCGVCDVVLYSSLNLRVAAGF
jgi:hypothetical protein